MFWPLAWLLTLRLITFAVESKMSCKLFFLLTLYMARKNKLSIKTFGHASLYYYIILVISWQQFFCDSCTLRSLMHFQNRSYYWAGSRTVACLGNFHGFRRWKLIDQNKTKDFFAWKRFFTNYLVGKFIQIHYINNGKKCFKKIWNSEFLFLSIHL